MSENESQQSSNPVLGAIENVKSKVETLVSDVNVGQLKNQVKSLVKEAQADFTKLVNKDLAAAKKKIAAEKALLEKEVKKQSALAKKFIATQKKEIAALQSKLEKLVAAKKKAPAKKAPAKKAVAKKVTKKAPAKKR